MLTVEFQCARNADKEGKLFTENENSFEKYRDTH